jgi:hypothetical protein
VDVETVGADRTPPSGGGGGLGARIESKQWAFVVLGLVLVGVGIAAWAPIPAGVWNDDGAYMLVGRALATGHGLHYEGVVGSPPAVKFPPLLPGLLAVLWMTLREIGPVTMAATLLNVVFLAAAGALFAKALADSTDLPRAVGVGVAGLAFVSADVLRVALVPLSEPLFLLLVMAALAVWARAVAPGASSRWWAGLSALLFAVVAARTAGVAVVAGFGVALMVRRQLLRAALVTGPAAVGVAAWSVWSDRMGQTIPEGARDLLGTYGGWLGGQLRSAPGTFLTMLPSQMGGVLERVGALLVPGAEGWGLWVAFIPLGLLAVWGAVRLARSGHPVGWIAAAYLPMLFVWPYLDRRLVVPLHPFAVAAVAVGAADLVGRLRAPTARRALIGALLLWAGSYGVVTAARVADGWTTAPYRLRAERLALAVEALRRTAPADAIVGAPEFWAGLYLHGGWQVIPSTRFDPRRTDPTEPMWGTPDEQIQLWKTAGVSRLLLELGGVLQGAALDSLEARCPGSVHIAARVDPLMVVELSGDCMDPGG